MTWTGGSAVDGTKNARENRPRINNNFTYIQTEQRKDHYWSEDANEDGHHRKVEMPDIEDSGVTVDATTGDPSGLSTDMKVMYYTRAKIAAESSDEFYEPFAATNDGSNMHYLQLGYRVLANIEMTSATAGDIKYSHNVNTTTKISQQSKGVYRLNFASALPSINYIPTGFVYLKNSSGTRRIQPHRQNTGYSTSFNVLYWDFDVIDSNNNLVNLSAGDHVLITISGG